MFQGIIMKTGLLSVALKLDLFPRISTFPRYFCIFLSKPREEDVFLSIINAAQNFIIHHRVRQYYSNVSERKEFFFLLKRQSYFREQSDYCTNFASFSRQLSIALTLFRNDIVGSPSAFSKTIG